jgi:hypothetical protein
MSSKLGIQPGSGPGLDEHAARRVEKIALWLEKH